MRVNENEMKITSLEPVIRRVNSKDNGAFDPPDILIFRVRGSLPLEYNVD